MTEKDWKVIFYAIVVVGLLVIGFYFGRKTMKVPDPTVVTHYINLPPIIDSIPYPKPTVVTRPADTADIIKQCVKDGIYQELFPEKIVTQIVEVTKDDTTAIMRDWATERAYSETLFDNDTTGKFVLNTKVQYNRMNHVSYVFNPKQKTTSEKYYVTKFFRPYVGLGGMVNAWDKEKDPMASFSLGGFVKEKYGLEVDYQRSFKSKKDYIGGKFVISF